MDAGDVRVLQAGGDLHLAVEPQPSPVRTDCGCRDQLERYLPASGELHGAPDCPHSPFTEVTQDAVAGNVRNW